MEKEKEKRGSATWAGLGRKGPSPPSLSPRPSLLAHAWQRPLGQAQASAGKMKKKMRQSPRRGLSPRPAPHRAGSKPLRYCYCFEQRARPDLLELSPLL